MWLYACGITILTALFGFGDRLHWMFRAAWLKALSIQSYRLRDSSPRR